MAYNRETDPEMLLVVAGMDLKAKRFADARRAYSAVLQLRPNDADVLYRLGVTEVELGRIDVGLSLIERAIVAKPAQADFNFGLAVAYARLNRFADALRASGRAVALAPENAEALGTVVAIGLASVKSGERFDTAPTAADEKDSRSISVVVCSREEQKGRRIRAQYEALLAGREFEIIQIYDARSLCEAYNRGFARTSGDVVIFSHDDIEIISENFATRLLRHLSSKDVVGVVGTSRLAGTSWIAAGWPQLHGCILHRNPRGVGFVFDCYGPRPSTPIQAIDGVLIAVNRSVCESIRFDEATFDGFHFYDLDFSHRAYLEGFHIGVAWDILLLHDSIGRSDKNWEKYATSFLAKHGSRMTPATGSPRDTWPSIALADQAQAVALHRSMVFAQDIR
ncbi:MAG: glycosyltransferase [Xanthobacteraceae bacterium]